MIITAKLCKERLEKFDPNLSVTSVKDYGTDFLVTYLYEGSDRVPDPFLLVNKKNGNISSYTIAEDPARYYSTPDVEIR